MKKGNKKKFIVAVGAERSSSFGEPVALRKAVKLMVKHVRREALLYEVLGDNQLPYGTVMLTPAGRYLFFRTGETDAARIYDEPTDAFWLVEVPRQQAREVVMSMTLDDEDDYLRDVLLRRMNGRGFSPAVKCETLDFAIKVFQKNKKFFDKVKTVVLNKRSPINA